MKQVTSSNIAAVGYDEDKKRLTVIYKSGGTYHYEGVSPETYAALEAADSIGQHVAKHIKGKHAFTKGGAE